MSSRRSGPLESSGPPGSPSAIARAGHIASGGMASVWCAEDRVLDRNVAIKILAERFAHDQVAVRRFKREARAAARVASHPHVVTVYDVGDLEPGEGEDGDGRRPFLVMEYLAGGTVADAIRVGAVRRHEAMRWIGEAASALDHAHASGIVHRDIKPANFLLDRSRVLHVADFGIARLVSEDTITSTDQLFGTAAYLSPEQALGREATSASDRYALAVDGVRAAGRRAAVHRPALRRPGAPAHRGRAAARRASATAAFRPRSTRSWRAGWPRTPRARFETAGAFVDALGRRAGLGAGPPGRSCRGRPPAPRGRSTPRPAAPPAHGRCPPPTRTAAGCIALTPRCVAAGARRSRPSAWRRLGGGSHGRPRRASAGGTAARAAQRERRRAPPRARPRALATTGTSGTRDRRRHAHSRNSCRRPDTGRCSTATTSRRSRRCARRSRRLRPTA